MIAQWCVEAGKYNVLPVGGRGVARFAEERPQIAANRTSYTFYPHTQPAPYNAGPRLLNRTHTITADVKVPEGGAEGALVSFGGTDGGYLFYIKDGKLQYVQNYVARDYLHVESTEPVPAGRHELRFVFEVTGPPDMEKIHVYPRPALSTTLNDSAAAAMVASISASPCAVERKPTSNWEGASETPRASIA